MNPRRMMTVGAVLVLAAVAVLAAALFFSGEETAAMKAAVPFDGGAPAPAAGGLVVVEGKVSVKNRVLVHDFVDAVREHQHGGSWLTLESYRQPLLAELPKGEIMLVSDTVCTAAYGDNTLEPGEKSETNRIVRYTGLKRGDPITAVGTLAPGAAATLAVKHWYSGTAAQYGSYLSSSRTGSYMFFAVLAVLGTGLCVLGWRKR